MNPGIGTEASTLLTIPGTAADHLYRQGSAKMSFWETIFGASLRAKRRARVSALPDGTHCFDVPVFEIEPDLLGRALAYMSSSLRGTGRLEAAALLGGKSLRVRLIGLQPRGESRAAFSLRVEPKEQGLVIDPVVNEAFRSWFDAEGARIAKDILIPFGFTPEIPRGLAQEAR